jgi:uncharacterized ion transporter superfamily protein YfcC
MYGHSSLSFLIPSSSGRHGRDLHGPLASFVDVPAKLVVTYQSASGLMNLFIPTSAVVMGGLAMLAYHGRLRWVWPLLSCCRRRRSSSRWSCCHERRWMHQQLRSDWGRMSGG